MSWILRTLRIGTSAEEQMTRLQNALHSLHARGSIENFRVAGEVARLQGGRGNFGIHLVLHKARDWRLVATPVANPVGPYAAADLAPEIRPMEEWVTCGQPVELGRLQRVAHLELIEWLREQEQRHPATDWLGQQFRRLADGERPPADDLMAVILLGGRRFLKSIPSADRLHETIEPAVATLLRMNSSRESADDGIFGEQNPAAAILQFMQEIYPLETKRAVQKTMLAS